MGRDILVHEKLLCDFYRLIFFLEDVYIPDEAIRLCKSILAQIDDKLRRRALRTAFSAYKMAPPGPHRESLRREYIRLSQIHSSFVSEQEIPFL